MVTSRYTKASYHSYKEILLVTTINVLMGSCLSKASQLPVKQDQYEGNSDVDTNAKHDKLVEKNYENGIEDGQSDNSSEHNKTSKNTNTNNGTGPKSEEQIVDSQSIEILVTNEGAIGNFSSKMALSIIHEASRESVTKPS